MAFGAKTSITARVVPRVDLARACARDTTARARTVYLRRHHDLQKGLRFFQQKHFSCGRTARFPAKS